MKKNIYPFCLIVLSLFGWLLVWRKLPESISIHIGGIGGGNWDSSTLGVFLFTNGLLIGVNLLMIILPKMKFFSGITKTYYLMRDLIVSILFLISVGAISISIGMGFNEKTLIMGSMGILLTLIVITFLFVTALFVTLMVALSASLIFKAYSHIISSKSEADE